MRFAPPLIFVQLPLLHFAGASSVPMIQTSPFAPIPMSCAAPGISAHVVPFHLKIWFAPFTTHGVPTGSTAIREAPPPYGTAPLAVSWKMAPVASMKQTAPFAPTATSWTRCVNETPVQPAGTPAIGVGAASVVADMTADLGPSVTLGVRPETQK
jgi:hypothetical protein